MWPFIESAIITSIVFICNSIFSNEKRKPYIYVLIFLMIACVNFLFGKVHASELEYPSDFLPNAKMEIRTIRYYAMFQRFLSEEDKAFYEEKVKFHKANGERTYLDANNKCSYLPDISERDKAKYCFTTALAIIGASGPYSKIVSATTTLLLQYGLDCMDEWAYINNKLHWSEYHFEMMEFYQEILRQG